MHLDEISQPNIQNKIELYYGLLRFCLIFQCQTKPPFDQFGIRQRCMTWKHCRTSPKFGVHTCLCQSGLARNTCTVAKGNWRQFVCVVPFSWTTSSLIAYIGSLTSGRLHQVSFAKSEWTKRMAAPPRDSLCPFCHTEKLLFALWNCTCLSEPNRSFLHRNNTADDN